MDYTVGISALNWSIHPPERRSNCSWGLFVSGSRKGITRKIGNVIGDSETTQRPDQEMDATMRFSAPDRFICPLEQRSNCSWGYFVSRFKKKRNNRKHRRRHSICRHSRWSYRKTDHTIRFSTLNWSIHPLEQRSSRSRGLVSGSRKAITRGRYLRFVNNQPSYRQTDPIIRFATSNKLIFARG